MIQVSFSHWGMFLVYAPRVVEDVRGTIHIMPEGDYRPDIGWMPRI